MSALAYFTPAREEELLWTHQETSRPEPSHHALSGEEAHRFYQTLVGQRDGEEDAEGRHGGEQQRRRREGARERRRRRREGERGGGGMDRGQQGQAAAAAASSSPTELQGLQLLRFAQEGDLSGLRTLLGRGVDVNFQDSFFWTALMCASQAGRRAAVKLLLQRGAAWVGVVDTQGRDARELAERAGHGGVVEELDAHGRRAEEEGEGDRGNRPQQQPRWCDVCASQYSTPLEAHLSSTLHQFSLRRPAPQPHYCLPPSSAPYRMMLRNGWSPGAGLGPEGGGATQPVRTVLKRDQKGLGFGPAKRPRVTHFQPKDPQAVGRPPVEGERRMRDAGRMKEESRRREEREKCWERDFRASFYS